MPHRQAYFPRLWPGGLAAVIVASAVQLGLGALLGVDGPVRVLVGVVIGATTGVAIAQLVFRRWKRRHPEVDMLGYLEVQRRNAPWN
jgi:hypothetical protein